MFDVKELAKGLQVTGYLPDAVGQALRLAYGESTEYRYQRARFSAALAKLTAGFPECKKVGVIRSPGRVNLLGFPLAHEMASSLSMSIDRDILVFFSPRKDRRINVINTSFCYPARNFEITRRIRPYASGNWGNHAKAAAQAVHSRVHHGIVGMDALVTGDIPVDSGLGSSSALTLGLIIALLEVNGLDADSDLLESMLTSASAYLSHSGSSLDDAHFVHGGVDTIEFRNSSAAALSALQFPPDYSFVICNSLVDAVSDEALMCASKCRAAECMMGLAINGESNIPQDCLSLREISKLISMSQRGIRESMLKLESGKFIKEPSSGFKIASRMKHLVTEEDRVAEAARALKKGDMIRFGDILNRSHNSCSTDYEISNPALDALVDILRDEGALGARMIGRGFGGCVAALAKDRDVPDIISAVINKYYNGYLQQEHHPRQLSAVALEDAIFPCKPSARAGRII